MKFEIVSVSYNNTDFVYSATTKGIGDVTLDYALLKPLYDMYYGIAQVVGQHRRSQQALYDIYTHKLIIHKAPGASLDIPEFPLDLRAALFTLFLRFLSIYYIPLIDPDLYATDPAYRNAWGNLPDREMIHANIWALVNLDPTIDEIAFHLPLGDQEISRDEFYPTISTTVDDSCADRLVGVDDTTLLHESEFVEAVTASSDDSSDNDDDKSSSSSRDDSERVTTASIHYHRQAKQSRYDDQYDTYSSEDDEDFSGGG